MLPACKSLNTLVNYLARRTARQKGAWKACCTTTAASPKARALTCLPCGRAAHHPPAEQVLYGITREVILQVMQEAGQPVSEAPLSTNLAEYEEIFISSTSMHVMPITTIDHQPVGNGLVGPITRRAMEKFNAYYQDYMKSQTL
jgi:D-alanine transaminase